MKLKSILLFSLICCVYCSRSEDNNNINGNSGFTITTKSEPIDPTKKKQLSNLVLKHPENFAADDTLFRRFRDKEDICYVPGVDADHLMSDSISDVLDEIIKSLQKKSDTDPIKYNKEKLFNVIEQFYGLQTPYKKYEEFRRRIPYLNYVQECQCLYRRYFPFRKEMEKYILEQVKQHNPDKKKELIITELASGDLYEIFMIANLLIDAGYKNLRLNCLDLKYSDILNRYKTELTPRHKLPQPTMPIPENFPWKEKTKSEIYDISGNLATTYNELAKLQTILKELSTLEPITGDRESEDFQNLIGQRMQKYSELISAINEYQIHKTIFQFVRWLTDDPNNKITIVFYTDYKNYIEACEKNPNLKSNVIFGADYNVEVHTLVHFWNELREKALKENGFAITILDKLDIVGASEDEPERYFLSYGSPSYLKHFEWIIKSTTKDKCISTYELKPIKAIPAHYKEEYDQDTGNTKELTMPEIPEIVSSKKEPDLNATIDTLAKALRSIR